MRDPLSADTVTQLRSDPTAALAACLILAGSFPGLLAWAQRTIVPSAAPNGVGHGGEKFQNGPRANGPHNPRESAAKHDEALLELMRANPHANVSELIRLTGRPRNSAVLSLERLEKAGVIEHASRGKWTVIDPDLLEAPAPRPAGWIAPLSGAVKAQHTAAMRVPDRLTTADA